MSCIVPTPDEITFVLEILDQVAGSTLDKIEALLEQEQWDNVNRNDFCR